MSLQHEVDILARTIWAESRGEPFNGQVAVAWVIRNRSRDKRLRWSRVVSEVCTQPKQFSCWNEDDPNRPKLLAVGLEDEAFVRAMGVACIVLCGDMPDASKGANHYFNPNVVIPSWAGRMEQTVTIGRHVFFRG